MEISLAAEKIGSILGFPITNTLLMTWFAMLVLIIVGATVNRNLSSVPSGLQNMVEAIFDFFLNLVDSIMNDRALTLRVFPIACTLFLLIVLSNWLGLLPGVGTIGFLHEVDGKTTILPLFRSANADINSTLSWAIISIVVTQFFGIVTLGFAEHANKFINLRGLFKFTFAGFIDFFVGLLETFGEISRMVSFSFRLFGNIFAGEVLLTVIASLVPYIAPLPFYFLELFVGLIQGIVFVTLTLVFIKIATASHAHPESGGEHALAAATH